MAPAAHAEPVMYAPVVAEMAKGRRFYPSHNFIIGCGTVTVDLSSQKVMMVYNKRHAIYQLPKGRKNIGEDMLSAALRETCEETGVRVTALPLKVGTRATPEDASVDAPEVTDYVVHTEPVAVCQYPDPYSGAMKMVFYFVATGTEGSDGGGRSAEDEKKFDTLWVNAHEAAQRLEFKEDGMVVKKALEDLRNLGYEI